MEKAEEWMGRLWIAGAVCNYKEIERQLKERVIHGITDKSMLIEIIQKLTAIKDTRVVTVEQPLAWAGWAEAQRTQTTKRDKGIWCIKSGRVGKK